MNRHNYLVRFIKKINLTINKLLKENLNKLNPDNFIKISRSNKFLLSLAVLIVLFISYLSIPNIYNKKEISIKLNNQLQKKLNFDFNLSENFEYNFLPRPHFIYRNSTISVNQNEISKIKELKVFISLKNLFSYENFKVRNLIIEKSNFNLDNQTYDFFTKLLDGEFKDGKLIIRDSNIFYRNKDDEVLFINKISNMEYFYDNKNLQNKIISKNEIFNLPYSIEFYKKNIDKKFFSKLNLDFLKLKINNELDFSKEVKKGFIKFTSNKDQFTSTYDVNKNNLIFNLFDVLENSDFSYEGKVNFNPFYLNLKGTVKEIDILNLLKSKSLILQLFKTEILNNKNLNIDINVYGEKSKNFSDLFNINLNSKIEEGLIDIDNSRFSWNDNVDFFLENSLIYVKDGELILDGKIIINIKNSDKVYKFLLTPKIYRNELTNIKTNFVYNFDQKVLNLNNILIDNKNNKDINKILESLIFKKNKLQNRVYLKNILNRAIKFYAG
jgi:hypothetical protein